MVDFPPPCKRLKRRLRLNPFWCFKSLLNIYIDGWICFFESKKLAGNPYLLYLMPCWFMSFGPSAYLYTCVPLIYKCAYLNLYVYMNRIYIYNYIYIYILLYMSVYMHIKSYIYMYMYMYMHEYAATHSNIQPPRHSHATRRRMHGSSRVERPACLSPRPRGKRQSFLGYGAYMCLANKKTPEMVLSKSR